jgi:hypothetical protein
MGRIFRRSARANLGCVLHNETRGSVRTNDGVKVTHTPEFE